ncbi:MAG: hypothetical protein ACRDOO_28570 [Actinomadura sp.]
MSALASSKSMMSIAQTEATAAMLVLPPAVMINFQFKLCNGEAEKLDKAGQKWREVADKLQKTATELQEAVAGVPADTWTGDDRTAYEQKVREVCQQLEIAATYYMAVGIALTAFAYALFTYAIFALGMGTFLAALAVAAAAALASVVGAPAYSGMLATAGTCLTITWAATGILAAASQMAAVVFQGGAALTALLEYQHGNKQALSDFAHAEAVGSVTAVTNLAQNAANAGLAYVNRTGGEKLPWMKAAPKGSPLSSIDLDADRDKDSTWTVGGTATVTPTPGGNEYTGGGHVKYGDHGWQGWEVEGKAKTETGHEVGGKVGYEDKDGFGQGKGGAWKGEGSYGYEDPTTGVGGKGEAGGSYNPSTGEWEAKGGGGATYRGGDVFKEEHEVKSDGHGNETYKQSSKSWYGDQESERKF